MLQKFVAAARDFRDGLRLAPVWVGLGLDQTVGRFRRTLLGPFWLSSGLLTLAVALTFVFGGLLGMSWRVAFPLILLGVLGWGLVGLPLGEAPQAFVSSGGVMQVQRTPLSFAIFLHMFRTVVNFGAQLITALVVLALAGLPILPHWTLAPGFLVDVYITFMLSLVIAFPATRFRDLGQAVTMVMGFMYFLTPIFWSVDRMGPMRRRVVELNPLAHELELIRAPLQGRAPTLGDWQFALGTAAVATVAAFVMLAFYRKRVIFWL